MKMHEGEIEIDRALVRELISTQFPQWADLPISPVPSMGTDNALFRVGDSLQARLPRIDWAIDNIEKEFTWLPQIAPFISVPITTPLHIGNPVEQYPYPWAIYDWLEGDNPKPGCAACGRQFVADIVDFMQQIQSVTLPESPRAARGMPLIERDGLAGCTASSTPPQPHASGKRPLSFRIGISRWSGCMAICSQAICSSRMAA